MVNELWYLVKVIEQFGLETRADGSPVSRRPTPMRMHLVMDGDMNALNLLQVSSLSSRGAHTVGDIDTYEPPRRFVEVATELRLWGNKSERLFWEDWVMGSGQSPTSEVQRTWAMASVASLVRHCAELHFTSDALTPGSPIGLSLANHEQPPVPVMHLEVVACIQQVFDRQAIAVRQGLGSLERRPENVTQIGTRPRKVLSNS